jgi:hypothetical protein
VTKCVDMKKLIPVDQLIGEDESDTSLLREMLGRAEQYLTSFEWCPPIIAKFFGCGTGGIVAVFLFKLGGKIGFNDDFLWVVEGDVPSAYLVTDNAPDATSALSIYCDLMEDWASAIVNGLPSPESFPVGAAPTVENAKNLLSRIRFIRSRIIPKCNYAFRDNCNRNN